MHPSYLQIASLVHENRPQLSDRSLAEIVLGYPAALDSSWYDQVSEVGYEDKLTGKLLTTFAVPASMLSSLRENPAAPGESAAPLMAHFVRYKTQSSGVFTLRLVLS